MEKNVASQKWVVFAFNETDNTALTGDAANINANLRIDGGAANAVDDTNPTELEDGYYVFDLSQAETNGDYILICPASSTANIQVIGVPGAVWTTSAPHDWIDGGRLDLLLDAVKAQTDDLPSGIPKNVALGNFQFLVVLSSDHVTPATGKTIVSQISKDGGAFADTSNSVAEIGSGMYKIDLIQAEMNADMLTLKFTETDCDQRTITIKTSA